MNAMTKILNALSFANVNNLGEFRALLRQIDETAGSSHEPPQRGSVSLASGSSPVAPAIRPVQGAL